MKKIALGLSLFALISAPAAFAGDAAAGKKLAETVCVGCHGVDGNSPAETFPNIAGQNASYIAKQLANFKTKERPDPTQMMTGIVAALSEADMKNVAAHYATQTPKGGKAAADKVELGQRIYRGGIADKGVAACTACHGPTGSGISTSGFPAVSGQYASYLEGQLKAFADSKRANDPNRMMRDIASKLTAEEMAAVASYMQGLK